jgi:mevalonate kinase
VGSGGAAINAILDRARPYIHGAELTGAGGGGFFMLLARDPEAAAALRTSLSRESRERGAFVYYCIAKEGLRICIGGEAAKLPESLSLN